MDKNGKKFLSKCRMIMLNIMDLMARDEITANPAYIRSYADITEIQRTKLVTQTKSEFLLSIFIFSQRRKNQPECTLTNP